jgi:hypothetical protein
VDPRVYPVALQEQILDSKFQRIRNFELCSKYSAKHLWQGTITQCKFLVSKHYKNEDRERSSGCVPGVRFSTRGRGFLYCQVKAVPGAVWPHI